jgi:ABC-type transport system substrate-binding protein
MKFMPILLAILLVASAVAPGFSTSQDSELILRVAMQDDMKGTNPITVSDVWSWNVLGYLYDGPVSVNPETDELIPYIAIGSAALSGKADGWSDCAIGNFGYSPKSVWENSTKQETIIFYDFENVKWHDGHQMDARDIIFSMHLAGQVPEWSSSMNPLKDHGGRVGSSNYSTTSWLHVYKVWESPDKMQAALRFQLQEPFADFFRSTLSTFLLPEHIWAYKIAGQTVDGAKIWCDAGYSPGTSDSWQVAAAQEFNNYPPIGNGPFKFEFWEKGQMSKTSTWREHFFRDDYKYKNYVGTDEYGRSLARQPNIDAITYRIFKTAEAAVLALKADDIDYIAWSVPPTFVQELSNEPGVALQQSPETGFFYLGYNMRKSSFGYKDGDPTKGDVGKPLRHAIAHCIDKPRIVTRLLLNLGIAGTGPVSPLSEWYNASIPTYDFDPDEAKIILRDAGYKLTDGSINATTGLADISKARDGNWWLNPDGTPIGSSDGGRIDILTPESNYDPRCCEQMSGLMYAQQLRDIGIYAQSVAMSFGSLVASMGQRNFDMFISGWRIGNDPSNFLRAFFHSSQAVVGLNYPGYQNKSFDEIIDLARSTSDDAVKKKAIFDAQAAIGYDLPIDVLYFRTNIEAYRSDRFTGWVTGPTGSIFNWRSIMNIRAPGPYKTIARFVSPPSAVLMNSSYPITIFVSDQDGNPLEGAKVWLNASKGALSDEYGVTTSTGKFTTTFSSQYVDWTDPEMLMNGSSVIIQIEKATYVSPENVVYNPAPSRLTLIKVFPYRSNFLSVSLSADPDIINPDMNSDGTFGFTFVDVAVINQNGDPVAGASVALSVSPSVLTIEPADQLTDAEGKARFKVTAANLSNDDGSIKEYVLKAIAIHPTDVNLRGENQINLNIVDGVIADPIHHPDYTGLGIILYFAFILAIIFLVPLAIIFLCAKLRR